jgi:RimJ/RimL family protein N-acetyltransferase
MKTLFQNASNITVKELSADDWSAYKDYWQSLKAPAHFSGIMDGKDLEDPQTYKDLFSQINEADGVMFGLWDGNTLIGQTGIFFEEKNGQRSAMFQGSEITDDYRGLGLSKALYDARMRYLHEIDYKDIITTSIRSDNEYSLKAAQKSGFELTDKTVHDKIVLQRQGVDLSVI